MFKSVVVEPERFIDAGGSVIVPNSVAFEGERGSRRSREAPWATSFMAVASHAFVSIRKQPKPSKPPGCGSKDTGF